jgi:hypothetical protein
MEFSELKASVRSRIWDAMTHNNWKELDDFSLILADKIASKLIARRAVNLTRIVSSTKTNFFTANSVSKKSFVAEVKIVLSDLITMYRPMKKRKFTRPTKSKDVPRIDFTDGVKRKVLRNQDSCCAKCGVLMSVIDWDHRDGDRSNNDISNARALCPNCHSRISRKRQMGIG